MSFVIITSVHDTYKWNIALYFENEREEGHITKIESITPWNCDNQSWRGGNVKKKRTKNKTKKIKIIICKKCESKLTSKKRDTAIKTFHCERRMKWNDVIQSRRTSRSSQWTPTCSSAQLRALIQIGEPNSDTPTPLNEGMWGRRKMIFSHRSGERVSLCVCDSWERNSLFSSMKRIRLGSEGEWVGHRCQRSQKRKSPVPALILRKKLELVSHWKKMDTKKIPNSSNSVVISSNSAARVELLSMVFNIYKIKREETERSECSSSF